MINTPSTIDIKCIVEAVNLINAKTNCPARVKLRLNKAQVQEQLNHIRGWRLKGKQISRPFVFSDFVGSMRFVNRVARIAESINHHPDITIRYNRVRLSVTTHDEGGLTMKDFRLARKVNQIVRP